ncbi:hypothetical protein F5876DRAFT_76912 [Lentinula aff. lateritia]|uniref:Uncharacterized protein n=1 Tax=Lentinula aff. lateritia TaxID=2804960 RepID=A0ACC1TZU3_9AGAR|nr:hypothetical protein F5876DRAFT_76912 [Lentinula aff. lateritia]
MPPSSTFPPEIYDRIIDEISPPSKDSLSTCSLVERSWVPRSRTHMFRRIDFKVPSIDQVDLHTSVEHTTEFQRNVASNTDVASYARNLVLTLTSSGNIASEIPQASKLHNLISLTLSCSNVIIYAVNDAMLTKLLSFIRHNQKLEHISVRSLVIYPPAFDVLMACAAIRAPALQSLHLQSIWGPDWITDAWDRRKSVPAWTSQSCRQASRLTGLYISHCENGVITTFLGSFDLRNLHRITLMKLDWGSCMTTIDATLNSTLIHFTLDLSDHTHGVGEERMFNRLVNILTVQLVLKRFSDAPRVLHGLQQALFHGNPCIQKLHLQFRQYPSPSDTMVDTALKELHLTLPSLCISIGFEVQEGIRPCATTANIGALFRWMGQTERLQFEALDDWWVHEATKR